MTTERDIRNQIQFARDKGLEEGMKQGMATGMEKGMEKGLEEGIEKGRQEIIARMKELGMSEDDIARIVGDN